MMAEGKLYNIGGMFLDPTPSLSDVFRGSQPTKKRGRSALCKGVAGSTRNDAPIEVKVKQGRLVQMFIENFITDEKIKGRCYDKHIRFPNGFWQAFCREVVRRPPDKKIQMDFLRSFRWVQTQAQLGAVTLDGLQGEFKKGQKRKIGGRHNSLLCHELDHHVFQFFVDCVDLMKKRCDTVLLMHEARHHKQMLINYGRDPSTLPKLTGAAGSSWFRRFRKRYNIIKFSRVAHLKVSLKKLKKRIGVWWANCFRLRFFWRRCFPETPNLRFISWDQKPAWFNNCANTGSWGRKGDQPKVKEIFAHSRARYTICTCVDSKAPSHETPHVAVLFKGTKGGPIIPRIEAGLDYNPPWFHLQVQKNGSYRADDMVELFRKTMHRADRDEDSCVYALDWFAAHRHPDVIAEIEAAGHIVLYHGGGTTGHEQVNDTHLHAQLQRELQALENMMAHRQAEENQARGLNTVHRMTRLDICNAVVSVWEMIDHDSVASVGYAQTGPGTPLEGKLFYSQIARDLRDVLKELDPHPDPAQIGTSIREDARTYVDEMIEKGIISTSNWKEHAVMLIDQHDPDDADIEGMEGAPIAVENSDDDDKDDKDDKDDEDDDGNVLEARITHFNFFHSV